MTDQETGMDKGQFMNNVIRGWRWHFFTMIFNVFMYIALNLGLLHPSVKAALKHRWRIKNVSYGPDRIHQLDIYMPKGQQEPLPVVMYIHGGGFGSGSKATHRIAAENYARLGYLVFNINYRLAPKHPYPAGIQDVCDAYAWIIQHAGEYGGDVSRLTVAGESAGGNLTASLLVGCCWKRPEPWFRKVWETAVVPKGFQVICSYLHVTEPHIRYARLGKARHRIARFVAKILNSFAYAYLGEGALKASDENLLVDLVRYFNQAPSPDRPIPPVFAPVGERDVIQQDTYDFADCMRQHGAIVDERRYKKEPHGFQLLMSRPRTPRYWRDCDAFMQQHVLGNVAEIETKAA